MVDQRKHNAGFAATETVMVVALFLIVFIAVLEVSMLCVRGELMTYATARVVRVASVYRNDFADLEAGVILPTTMVEDDSSDNVDVRVLSTSYVPFTLTRVNVFRGLDTLEYHLRAVPTLPDDITDDELGGDNPLPYCKLSDTEIRPCDP